MKILGPEVGYTDLLDFEISEKVKTEYEEKKAGKRTYSPLRPSSAGFCARRLAYELMEHRGHAFYEKPLLEPHVYRLFELGHAIEYKVLRTFQLLKVVQQKYKQQILTFFPIERGDESLPRDIIEGSCDFVFWSPEYKAIGDVKSKKDKWSAAFKSDWDETLDSFSRSSSLVQLSDTAFYADDLDEFISELGDDFLTDNLYQLNLYACSEFMVSRGVDHAFLYRYNKNDSRHMEIRFRPSMRAYNYVRDKFNTVSVAVDNKKPGSVEREFVLGSARCAFCPVQGECWGDENTLRAFWNTQPKKSWPKKTHQINDGEKLEELFSQYEALETSLEKHAALESQILKLLTDQKVTRVKLDSGHVYDVKYLKTPRPHFELKRSKL